MKDMRGEQINNEVAQTVVEYSTYQRSMEWGGERELSGGTRNRWHFTVILAGFLVILVPSPPALCPPVLKLEKLMDERPSSFFHGSVLNSTLITLFSLSSKQYSISSS